MRTLLISFLVISSLISCKSDQEALDILIINGQIIDGSGSDPMEANVGVRGDSILFVETDRVEVAKTVIDATGYMVTPGFIDPHTHATGDLRDSVRNSNVNYLTQGVTTVFIGNDGRSAEDIEVQFNLWEEQGIGTNAVTYVGHSTIRRAIMGMRDETPSIEELGSMKALLKKGMEAGAIGLSSGLYYAPASYSDTEEVIELAKVISEYGGVYDVHMRDESSYNIGLLDAVRETIRIAEIGRVHGHIAHIKCLGVDVWGQSSDVIQVVEEAKSRGVSITADQYPYNASGTSITGALVPRWFLTDDSTPEEKLANPRTKNKLIEEMTENLRRRGGPDKLLLTRPNETDSDFKGQTLAQVAKAWDMGPVEAAIQIFLNGGSALGSFNMKQEDMINFMQQAWVMTGSDGSGGHPRKYGSFPKKIREYVMDKQVLSLPEMIRQSAGLPATTFNLNRRGFIKPGFFADIIIFKPEEVRDKATFEDPEALSEGMEYVLVNGQLTVEKGIYNGTLAGKGLRYGK